MGRATVLAGLLFLGLFVNVFAAEPTPYISPGVQIGYTFEKGTFIGAQLSLGVYFDENTTGGFTSGVAFGFRVYKTESLIYQDVQLGSVLAGAGLGMVHKKTDNKYVYYGEKYKLWAGVLGLGTLDFINTTEGAMFISPGLMGVFPLGSWNIGHL